MIDLGNTLCFHVVCFLNVSRESSFLFTWNFPFCPLCPSGGQVLIVALGWIAISIVSNEYAQQNKKYSMGSGHTAS